LYAVRSGIWDTPYIGRQSLLLGILRYEYCPYPNAEVWVLPLDIDFFGLKGLKSVKTSDNSRGLLQEPRSAFAKVQGRDNTEAVQVLMPSGSFSILKGIVSAASGVCCLL
jgi:hypothetical protein